MTEILNTWKEIAAHLKVSVGYAKRLAKNNKDFPVFRDHRVFTTRKALNEWIEKKSVRQSMSEHTLTTL